MKISAYILITIGLLGCSRDMLFPVLECSPPFESSNSDFANDQKLNAILDKYYSKGYPGLALAVKDSTDKWWYGTRGYASIEQNKPLLPCHLHHSASVSKTYIASTVLLLNEKGLIDLDSPVQDYLENGLPVDNINCATIRQLLGHRSGIYDFDTNPKIYVDYFNNPMQISTWSEIIDRYVRGEKAYFTCGSDVKYSDTNYMLLGVIIERITGRKLGDVVRDLLLQPNNLSETYYKSSPGYPDIDLAANNYFYLYENKLQNCTDWQRHFADIGMGQDGIIASPSDYIVFLDRLVSGKIVAQSSLELMMDFLPSDITDTSLGLGLERIEKPNGVVYGHTGAGFGTMILLLYEPSTKTTFFVGSNLGSIFKSDAGRIFYNEFLNELISVIKH